MLAGFAILPTIFDNLVPLFVIPVSLLTLSWRRPWSYRNQSIDLRRKSMDWFLYDHGLRHERVKYPRHSLQQFFITLVTTVSLFNPFHTLERRIWDPEPKTEHLTSKIQDSSSSTQDQEPRHRKWDTWPRFRFYVTHCLDISCTNGFGHMEIFITS